jgi:hypothetical protein
VERKTYCGTAGETERDPRPDKGGSPTPSSTDDALSGAGLGRPSRIVGSFLSDLPPPVAAANNVSRATSVPVGSLQFLNVVVAEVTDAAAVDGAAWVAGEASGGEGRGEERAAMEALYARVSRTVMPNNATLEARGPATVAGGTCVFGGDC